MDGNGGPPGISAKRIRLFLSLIHIFKCDMVKIVPLSKVGGETSEDDETPPNRQPVDPRIWYETQGLSLIHILYHHPLQFLQQYLPQDDDPCHCLLYTSTPPPVPEGKTEIKDPGQEHTVNPDPSVPEVTAPPAEQAPPKMCIRDRRSCF